MSGAPRADLVRLLAGLDRVSRLLNKARAERRVFDLELDDSVSWVLPRVAWAGFLEKLADEVADVRQRILDELPTIDAALEAAAKLMAEHAEAEHLAKLRAARTPPPWVPVSAPPLGRIRCDCGWKGMPGGDLEDYHAHRAKAHGEPA